VMTIGRIDTHLGYSRNSQLVALGF
jgi:hypothetical protein